MSRTANVWPVSGTGVNGQRDRDLRGQADEGGPGDDEDRVADSAAPEDIGDDPGGGGGEGHGHFS